MKVHIGTDVGYNAQTAVDDKNRLIVAVELTNEATDRNWLRMAIEAKDVLGAEQRPWSSKRSVRAEWGRFIAGTIGASIGRSRSRSSKPVSRRQKKHAVASIAKRKRSPRFRIQTSLQSTTSDRRETSTTSSSNSWREKHCANAPRVRRCRGRKRSRRSFQCAMDLPPHMRKGSFIVTSNRRISLLPLTGG